MVDLKSHHVSHWKPWWIIPVEQESMWQTSGRKRRQWNQDASRQCRSDGVSGWTATTYTGGAISLPHYQWSLIIRVNRSLDHWRSMRKVSVSSTKGKSAAEIKGIFPWPYPAATLGICLTKIPFMRHNCESSYSYTDFWLKCLECA